MMNIKWKKSFMDTAYIFADHSTCARLHVGAVLVKDKRIISVGYNGVPSGVEHCIDHFTKLNVDVNTEEGRKLHHEFSERYEIHAEQNCILYAVKSGVKIDESCTLFTTTEPCENCSKTIAAIGIKNVVYDKKYNRSSEGTRFLHSLGINISELNN